jgi:hypothetical protein
MRSNERCSSGSATQQDAAYPAHSKRHRCPRQMGVNTIEKSSSTVPLAPRFAIHLLEVRGESLRCEGIQERTGWTGKFDKHGALSLASTGDSPEVGTNIDHVG